MINNIKLIDLFAGPGGLGEGFSSIKKYERFNSSVSVEMDQVAVETLRFRKFYRIANQEKGKLLQDYYSLLENPKSFNSYLENHKNKNLIKELNQSVWNHELGSISPEKTYWEISSRLNSLKKKQSECIIIGGPPCQAYSLSGRSRRSKMLKQGAYIPKKDERHFLYQQYLGLLPMFKPAIFIMENVPGILSSKMNGGFIFEQILDDLRNIEGKIKYELFPLTKLEEIDMFDSYKGKDFQINCEEYGVPQARKRVIIMGIRSDLLSSNAPKMFLEKNDQVSVENIIGSMPKLRSGVSKIKGQSVKDSEELWKREVTNWYGYKKGIEDKEIKEALFDLYLPKVESLSLNRGAEYLEYSNYKTSCDALPKDLRQWIIDRKLNGFSNSSTRAHMDTDLKRYMYNSVYTQTHGKAPLLSNVPDLIKPAHANKNEKIHQDRFRTLNPNRPSKTITSHISKDGHAFIHYDPTQCRSLTVREAARIQTFPDNYFFCGNRTQQYHQVGNAVPPYLAKQIAEVVSNYLESVGI